MALVTYFFGGNYRTMRFLSMLVDIVRPRETRVVVIYDEPTKIIRTVRSDPKRVCVTLQKKTTRWFLNQEVSYGPSYNWYCYNYDASPCDSSFHKVTTNPATIWGGQDVDRKLMIEAFRFAKLAAGDLALVIDENSFKGISVPEASSSGTIITVVRGRLLPSGVLALDSWELSRRPR